MTTDHLSNLAAGPLDEFHLVHFHTGRPILITPDSEGCKWSSLNAPGTETPLSHSILKLDEFPFPIIGPLGQ